MKKITVLLAFCTLVLTSGQAQIINTIAGNGFQGFSGDGGAAISAELYNPSSVALDGSGNVYIADFNNNRIRKISTTGIISTVAGNGSPGYSGDGGPATVAELYYPIGVGVDGSGNVYITDGQHDRIRKINTAGIISAFAGDGNIGYSGDGGAATAAALSNPDGLTVDGSGNLYIADAGNYRVRKVNTSGIISTFAGDGYVGYSGDGGAATATEINDPAGLAVDGSMNVYINDYGNGRIRKVNTAGIISTIAGNGFVGHSGDGGAATAAELYDPYGVAVDGPGNIYIGDWYNNRIRRVTTAGVISTFAGDGTNGYFGDGGAATASELGGPTGVAVDGSGNVYIADEDNNRIRKVTGLLTGFEQFSMDNEQFSVYPNPASQTLYLRFNTQGISSGAKIMIMDITGKEVYTGTQTLQPNSQNMIDISNLAQGMYFMSIENSSGAMVTKKFVKL